MSHTPPPFTPPISAYESPVLASMPFRPVSVTVLAIIVIVFSSIGILCSPFSLLPFFTNAAAQNNPVVALMHSNILLKLWTIFGITFGMILAVVNLIAAIGALKLKPASRRVMIGVAIIQIVMSVIGLGVTLLVMMPPLMNMAHSSDPAIRIGAIGGIIGGLGGFVIGDVLPVLIIYFFRTPYVINAFEGMPYASAI